MNEHAFTVAARAVLRVTAPGEEAARRLAAACQSVQHAALAPAADPGSGTAVVLTEFSVHAVLSPSRATVPGGLDLVPGEVPPDAGDVPFRLAGDAADEARRALDAWDRAVAGDSGDAELEAGLQLADILRGLCPPPTK